MSVKCECDKCGCVAMSIPATAHRRCTGKGVSTPRPKHAALPGAHKGVWQVK